MANTQLSYGPTGFQTFKVLPLHGRTERLMPIVCSDFTKEKGRPLYET